MRLPHPGYTNRKNPWGSNEGALPPRLKSSRAALPPCGAPQPKRRLWRVKQSGGNERNEQRELQRSDATIEPSGLHAITKQYDDGARWEGEASIHYSLRTVLRFAWPVLRFQMSSHLKTTGSGISSPYPGLRHVNRAKNRESDIVTISK